MIKSLSALIIYSDLGARARLTETLKSIAMRCKLESVRSKQDGLKKLELGEKYDCIFLASSKDESELAQFFAEARAIPEIGNPLFIVVLKTSHQSSVYVAKLYINGFHGFICEPFSSEKLLELVRTVKEERSRVKDDKQKTASAIGFLIGDLINSLDLTAIAQAKGNKAGGHARKEFKLTAEALRKASEGQDKTLEYELVSRFTNIAPPKEVVGKVRKAKVKKVAPHPGSIIKKAMAKRKISEDRILAAIKISAQEFEAILNEQKPLTEAIAKDLAHAIGETPGYWFDLQKAYDLMKSEEAQNTP